MGDNCIVDKTEKRRGVIFQLDHTSVYGLSYLDDIAFEWIDQAIHGLETMMPFCVKGFLEPDRFFVSGKLLELSYRL